MRKTIFGGLIAIALALAPAAGVNAATYAPNPGDELHGSISAETGAPGDEITYTAPTGTYQPGEAVSYTIRAMDGSYTGAPIALPADFDGSHSFSFVIPASAKNGDQFEITVLRADGSVWDRFIVTAVVKDSAIQPDPNADAGSTDTAGSGSGGGLAMTGSDIAITGIATGAVLLFVGGLVLLVVRRRRSRADATA